MIDEAIKKQFQKALLAWFEKNKRTMPWRETDDPYKIWLSEIMLQQTQAATVEGYYLRFIERFPNVQSLAEADTHDVMKAWEGLGYYSRARNLHKAAKEVVVLFGGKVPDTLPGLLSLPGIGRYTAGAILSLAFQQPAPVLDGNVIRVLTRIFHLTDNVGMAATQKMMWNIAESLLPQKNAGSFNESMMELGALVCFPKKPLCHECPVRNLCEAHRMGIEESLPVRTPKKPVPCYDVTAGVIWKGRKFLITLRPPKGLLGGLWEFPGGKLEAGESLEDCLAREIHEELGIQVDVKSLLISVRHAYTHFKITLHVFQCRYVCGDLRPDPQACEDFRWITPNELDDFAFPGADRKVIAALKWLK